MNNRTYDEPADAASEASDLAGKGIAAAGRSTRLQKLKFVAFSVAAALLLLVGVELVVRFCGFDAPDVRSSLQPADFDAVHRNDSELFYSLRPSINVNWKMAGNINVVTNRLGLRGPEVGPKAENEFRILSLGESSTFGDRVEYEQTYSALLEQLLSQSGGKHTYRVINAGVCAYSSFQSLKYLELRGLELEPDMVLFYHELADFLPTTNRDVFVPDPFGLALSDKQLYRSKRHRLSRALIEHSAIYRLMTAWTVRRRLMNSDGSRAEVTHVQVPWSLSRMSTPDGVRSLNLPARVPLDERKENFYRLLSICRENGIQLIVIHPSYRGSKVHECDLTEFCRRNDVPMFDAYESLHPDPSEPGLYFADFWHPNPEGHESLAGGLFRFLIDRRLVPSSSTGALQHSS